MVVFRTKAWWSAAVAVIIAMSLVSMGCSKDEEEEESDPLLGVWKTSCERYFPDDTEIAYASGYTYGSTIFCGDPDALTGDAATRSDECNTKYQQYYYRDTVTIVDAADAGDEAVYPTLTYARTTFYNEDADEAADCSADDKIATFARTLSYQSDRPGLLEEDDVRQDPDKVYADDAVSLNLQTVSATLTYHVDDYFEDRQNALALCETDDWEADKAVDISDKDNCRYNPWFLVDNFGMDTGYGQIVTGTDSYSYYSPARYISGAWETTDGSYSSTLKGIELYTIHKIDTSEDPKQLSLGNFFDVNPFYQDTLATFDIFGEDYDEDADVTSAYEDGDNDADRQPEFAVTLEYDEEATADLE